MSRTWGAALRLTLSFLLLGCLAASGQGQLVLLDENFNGVELGFNVDEGRASPEDIANATIDPAFTHTPPAGWAREFTHPGVGDPEQGVEEYEGWTFVTPEFWLFTADQTRSQFVDPTTGLGSGVIAVADGDEWDDIGEPATLGFFNSFLTTPAISIAGADANSAVLSFASSWRPECCDDVDNTNNQTATIMASFDGGPAVEVLRWDSDGASPTFKPDSQNESVMIPLNNPGGASTVVLEFGYTNAANDWWWAVDNLSVDTSAGNAFAENFDGLSLGPNVQEGLPEDNPVPRVYSATGPAGWSVDRSNVPEGGVTEFTGWNFLSPGWWKEVAEDQGRTGFTKGSRVVVVADGDEWDDKDPSPSAQGPMDTTINTPELSLVGVRANTAMLMFDSSWRAETPQTAQVFVSYDGGEPVEVLLWSSDSADPNFHDDNTDETVMVPLNNPNNASSAVISFRYVGGNNWWWALDNVKVTAREIPEPSSWLLGLLAASGMAIAARRRR